MSQRRTAAVIRRKTQLAICTVLPQRLLARLWHNPLFDSDWYRRSYQDVATHNVHPERHFRRHGWRENRNPNEVFDTAWYLSEYPDVVESRLNPLDHYLLVGADEGHDPGPLFSTTAYVNRYPDVGVSGLNPLLHYLRYGRAEGREVVSDAGHPPRKSISSIAARPLPSPMSIARPGHEDRSSKSASVGVILHLFHTELWPEIRSFLENLPEFRLYVSLANETGAGFHESILRDFAAAEVRYFPNRGRDMGPFVEFLADGVLDDCSIICKIHSKRSLHRVDGDEWRRRLLAELMGSPATVRRVLDIFAADPSAGLIGPAAALTNSDEYWGSNRETVRVLGTRMGAPEAMHKLNFFAGSMFWFRSSALAKLKALGLRMADFEPERGEIDGALQHALERTIPIAVAAANYRLVSLDPAPVRAQRGISVRRRELKLIAYYLPQFHPIPENDEWWGPGFTEWTLVSKSRPLYDGHPQPRLPTALGFYDLREPDVRHRQVALARQYGIYGFCYYYYWFDGRRILERPLNDMLASGEPDFPFCICWANENWTRRWDGLDNEILLKQSYSLESSRRFIRDVIPILADPRYVRYEGRPVLLIYRVADIPEPRTTLALWRDECRRAGLGEIHVAGIRFWDAADVHRLGFDAAVDFPPHQIAVKNVGASLPGLDPQFTGLAYDYRHVVKENLRTKGHGYRKLAHRGVMLAWDNTPRRGTAAHFAYGATPHLYREWLSGIIDQEMKLSRSRESLIFINAWNEWGEGANLEPDSQFDFGFLQATREAIDLTTRSHERRSTRTDENRESSASAG